MTTFVPIVSMLFSDMGFGLCPSLIVSTVSGREFIIASVSVIIACRDFSSKLCPCVCSKEFKIALDELIWHSQIPPMWLAARPWSWRKFSILLWSISHYAFNKSCSAPTKLEPLSDPICLIFSH